MKRIIITTIFIASALFAANGQPAIKFWDDSPLTFNDFQVRHISLDESPFAQAPQPMDLDGGFVGETVKGKEGNLRYSYTRYRTYMDQLNSWYDPTYATPADLRFMQGIFKNRFVQAVFSTLHPTLAFSLGNGWSGGNRKRHTDYHFRGEQEPLYKFALEQSEQVHVDCFIFGHFHDAVDLRLPTGSRLIVLKDWIAGGTPHAVLDHASGAVSVE